MKLNEIFDPEYYDQIQDDMKRKKFDRDEDVPSEDSETSIQDFILSKYETGKISYEQAFNELRKATPEDQMFFWEMELGSARDLMDD